MGKEKDKDKKQKRSKILLFVGSAVLMAAGFVIIPPFIGKCSESIYKSWLNNKC